MFNSALAITCEGEFQCTDAIKKRYDEDGFIVVRYEISIFQLNTFSNMMQTLLSSLLTNIGSIARVFIIY